MHEILPDHLSWIWIQVINICFLSLVYILLLYFKIVSVPSRKRASIRVISMAGIGSLIWLVPHPSLRIFSFVLFLMIPAALLLVDQIRTRKFHSGFFWILFLTSVVLTFTSILNSKIDDLTLFFLIVISAGFFPFHSWMYAVDHYFSRLEAVIFFNVLPGAALFLEFISRGNERASRLILGLALLNAFYRSGSSLARKTGKLILADLQASFLAMTMVSLYTGELSASTFIFLSTTSSLSFFVLNTIDVQVIKVREFFRLRPHENYLGMQHYLPRGSRLFLIVVLVLMGIPGGSGFLAEDLLFHGLLNRSGLAMIGFLAVAGLNALSLYRLYSKTFLGPCPISLADQSEHNRMMTGFMNSTDLSPSLSGLLGGVIALLLILGLVPQLLLNLRFS